MAASAAAVVTASVIVTVVMVITGNAGIKLQLSCQQSGHRFVSIAPNTAVEFDIRILQRHLRTAANTTANQAIDTLGF